MNEKQILQKEFPELKHDYKYSAKEIGHDHSINPNYYHDSGLGHWMLMKHMTDIFPKDYTRGFLVYTILKYIKRYRNKDGIQDLNKAMTNLKFLIHFEQGEHSFKQ